MNVIVDYYYSENLVEFPVIKRHAVYCVGACVYWLDKSSVCWVFSGVLCHGFPTHVLHHCLHKSQLGSDDNDCRRTKGAV